MGSEAGSRSASLRSPLVLAAGTGGVSGPGGRAGALLQEPRSGPSEKSLWNRGRFGMDCTSSFMRNRIIKGKTIISQHSTKVSPLRFCPFFPSSVLHGSFLCGYDPIADGFVDCFFIS